MDRIHKKSALGETTELLLAAHERGADLQWERYERQLPLCGFTSNGLNCRKCFQGPCRINPFGDEPRHGICGADRDQIVMENLFQATLEGVMESARTVHMLGGGEQEIADIGTGLPSAVVERLSKHGLLPVRKQQLLSVRNSYFSHKGYLTETLRDLTRLGLINYGLLRQGDHRVTRPPLGQAAFDPAAMTVLVAGQPPAELVQALEQQAGRGPEGTKLNLVGEGGSGLPYLQTGIDHGSPELALGMGVDAIIIAPGAGWPGLPGLAGRYDLPVILLDAGKSFRQIASEVIAAASQHARSRPDPAAGRLRVARDPGNGSIPERGRALTAALEAGRIRGVAVVLGEPNVQQAFFERTLAVLQACITRRVVVLLGGALGAHVELLASELRKRTDGQLSAFGAELQDRGLAPFATFGSVFDLPRLLSLLAGLRAAHGADAPVLVVLPELFRTSTWAAAVMCLALGFAVQLGVRLPFWGSPALTQIITEEWRQITGGRLLAGPSLPEASAQAEEIAAFFKA